MPTFVKSAVKAAQKSLTETPWDAGHDLSHHEAVWENCLMIIRSEHLEDQIDLGVLHVAVMWHDFERDEKVPQKTIAILQKTGVSQEFIDKVIALIGEHSFD